MKSVAAVAAVALVLLASPATAHKTLFSNNGKVELIYGFLDEPVATYQKTGLDFGVFDFHGTPIVGLEKLTPHVNVTLTYGSTPDKGVIYVTNKLLAQDGRPGWYTYPVVFTQPGDYYLHVRGTINGTNLQIDLAPTLEMRVAASSDYQFPETVTSPQDQTAQIAQLQKDLADLKKQVNETKASPLPADGLVVALAFAVLVARRRAD